MAVMDKWLVLESLIPMLEKVTSREPGVLMAMLGIYDEVRMLLSCRVFWLCYLLSINHLLRAVQVYADVATGAACEEVWV